MPRHSKIPSSLVRAPFTVDAAKQAGLDRWHLDTAAWKRIAPRTYISSRLEETSWRRIEAASLRLPPGAAFSGLTAAWLHGLDVDPCSPIEATVQPNAGVSGRVGMAIRRAAMAAEEIVLVRGMRALVPVSAVAGACCRLSLTEGVVVLDAAAHKALVEVDELIQWARRHPGHRGVRNLRRAIDLADPKAESPMESRLRMVLVLGGLPQPSTQAVIHDAGGRFVARLDLYYAQSRLGIEYDGQVHRESLAEDNRRQNSLLSAGVRLLRFTAGDVLGNPDRVVDHVRRELSTATAGTRVLKQAG